MPEILSPGVYVEEVSTAPQIVPGVTTSNLGIAGYAPQGPANTAVLVQSYEQFSRTFGGLSAESVMPLSLAAFFANGGRRAYIVRVTPSDAVSADAKIQSASYNDQIATGDGTTTPFTGSIDTAGEAAPLVPGTSSVNWRIAGTPVSAQAARNGDNTAALSLVNAQAIYNGRINPSSIPAVDPTLDALVRGTVNVEFTIAAIGAVSVVVPVGTAAIVNASVGNSTNGALVQLDHRTGRFSLKLLGTYVPAVAATYATLDLSVPTTNVDTIIQAVAVGTPGNSVQIRFLSTGSASLVIAGNQVTFNFNSGATTVGDFEAAVAAATNCPFEIQTPGTAGNVLGAGDVIAYTNLAGGAYNDEGPITCDFTPASATKNAVDARGSITVVAGASLIDGETVVVTHGATTVTFEFDNNGTASGVAVPFTGADTAATVQANLIAAINSQSSTLLLSASAVGSDKIKLLPTTGAVLAVQLSDTVAAGGFVVSPATSATTGIWIGDVASSGSLNYETGAYSLTAAAAPHNKSPVVASYTRNAWDLNPISAGAWGNNLRVQVSGSVNYYSASTGTYSRFDVLVALYDSTNAVYNVVEQYEELNFTDPTSSVYFADVINELSDYITVTEPAGDAVVGQLQSVSFSEVLAGGTGAAQTVDVSLSKSSLQPRTISISYVSGGVTKTITDDGNGSLVGDVGGATNTVDYDNGALVFTTSAAVDGGTLIVASFAQAAAEAAHSEDFGDTAKNYTVGEEGTFDSTHWGRSQFTSSALLAADYKGIYAFNKVDEILQMALPDFAGNTVITGDLLDYAATRAAQPHGGDRFILLTTPKGYSAQQAVDWFRFSLGRFSNYAALYWPWVRVTDPLSNNRPKTIPALGHIAGVYARTDNSRNVGKSPGGTVDGALTYLVGLETDTTLGDRDITYPNKINPLISGPQTGLAVWGVRTISNVPDWQYINARRLFMYLEKSVYNSLWWTVFENNGPNLWAKVTAQLTSFMSGLYSQGYFAGVNSSQAFFVVCDSSNNTAESIEAGQLIVDIGAAPNKPAEFIRARFQQKTLNS